MTRARSRHWYPTEADARMCAHELIEAEGSSLIVSPVMIEFLAGTQSKDELRLARAFIDSFEIADQGKFLKRDWVEAKRLAEHVPRSGRPRDLGDCLIAALANRLKLEVRTGDSGFPK